MIQHDPSVRAALAGRRNGLSNLLSPAGMPPGFLSATSYGTPFGRRVKVRWVREDAMRAMLAQYLRYVAHYPGARVYLLDGNNEVIGSSTGSQRVAAADPTTAAQSPGMFVAVSRLHVAPWRVLYTVPTKKLYASNGYEAALSFLLLGAFGVAALVCVFLLVRLSSRSSALAKANVELAARSAEAEQANNAKSQFLATMSHELRTPLNAIIGFADLMHDGRLGPVSEQHRESLDDIRGSARHLLDLINEVLDLARIESGRILLDIQSIDPVEASRVPSIHYARWRPSATLPSRSRHSRSTTFCSIRPGCDRWFSTISPTRSSSRPRAGSCRCGCCARSTSSCSR